MKSTIKIIMHTLITFAITAGVFGITILLGIVVSFLTDYFGFIGGFGIYFLVASVINSILIHVSTNKLGKENEYDRNMEKNI